MKISKILKKIISFNNDLIIYKMKLNFYIKKVNAYIYIYIYIYIYCLATLMSSDRTKQICLWMTIEIYILPYPRGVDFSGEEENRVAISGYCKPLRRWIEVSATVERMYVNNSNCDS